MTDTAEYLVRILYNGVDIEEMSREELLLTVRAIARDYEIECKAHHAANVRHAEFLKRAFRGTAS